MFCTGTDKAQVILYLSHAMRCDVQFAGRLLFHESDDYSIRFNQFWYQRSTDKCLKRS